MNLAVFWYNTVKLSRYAGMDVLELTKSLIRSPSISPIDAGCQQLLASLLTHAGFKIHSLPHQQAHNLWATHGSGHPLFVFAGHTDVVPVGKESEWATPPFEPTIIDNKLYGRGAADMKGSLAAMVIAAIEFVQQCPQHNGTIALLITSAEEGPSELGTPIVLNYLHQQGIIIDYCVVGEPTCDKQFGDTIKNGRRGSLTGQLVLHGKQGHIAYPHLAHNPIHSFAPILAKLVAMQWDNGNDFFAPTSFQLSNVHAGTGAGNVIPGELTALFNFRYSPEVTATQLQTQVEALVQQHHADYQLQWTHYGEPFLTEPGKLTQAMTIAIQEHCQLTPTLSTSGGTSDARYIAKTGAQVIEFGPINATIHQVNEHVVVDELEKLRKIYSSVLSLLL
jgi:succinyl-diaminopimelate desuccinylase